MDQLSHRKNLTRNDCKSQTTSTTSLRQMLPNHPRERERERERERQRERERDREREREREVEHPQTWTPQATRNQEQA